MVSETHHLLTSQGAYFPIVISPAVGIYFLGHLNI
jgi:hypothetical protein